MILGMSVGAFTILHVIITLVAIGSGLIVVGGMFGIFAGFGFGPCTASV